LRLALVFKYVELITCCSRSIEAQNRYRRRWTRFFYNIPTLIMHGLDLTVMFTGKHIISYFQRSVLNKDRRYISFPLVKECLNDSSRRSFIRIRFQFEDLCLKQNFLEQFLNTKTRLGRNI